MANKPQALIKLSGPNRKVSFISEDGETINAIKEGINTYKLSGSDSPTPIIESVYTYKGSKATYDELPTGNNKVGDVWNVVAAHDTTPAGTNYAWTGTEWDALGGTYTDTNTWRPIQVGGTDKLTDATTSINFAGGGGTSVSYENGTITVSSPAIGTESTQVAAGNHTHSGYAATSHNHTTSQITDFPTLAAVATSGSYNDLKNKPTIPAAYTLPTAAANVLGGVKVGSGLSITDGVLSATGGGGSSDAGTKVVTDDAGDKSLQAVTSYGYYVGNSRGRGAVDLQHERYEDTQIASGEYSVAMGYGNTASGDYSVVMGDTNTASGDWSVVFGAYNVANGESSVAMGYNNTTSGHYSVVTGKDASNTVDGVVCNNNRLEGVDVVFNTNGNCGFKGITCNGIDTVPIWNLSVDDIFIAKIHIIDVNTSTCQVQNIIVKNCTFLLNETEFPKDNPSWVHPFVIANGVLTMAYAGNEYQIGIFYTLSKGGGGSNSSSSSSSSS